MNEQNLVPMNKRTESEQRKITRAGGIKSGETRRRNRDIKKIVAAIMQAAPDTETAERLRELGIDERDITNKTAMVYSLYEQAMKGNVKAFEALMKYSGEDPDQERKAAELMMKRDIHLLEINDRERFSLDFFDNTREREAAYILGDIKDRYKELKNARNEVMSENAAAESYDDVDDLDDDDTMFG